MPLKQNRKLYSNYYEAAHHNKACLPYQISDILLAVLLKSGGTCNCKWKMPYLLYLCLLSTNLEKKNTQYQNQVLPDLNLTLPPSGKDFVFKRTMTSRFGKWREVCDWSIASAFKITWIRATFMKKKKSRCPACQASEILHVLLAWQIHMNHSLLHFPLW